MNPRHYFRPRQLRALTIPDRAAMSDDAVPAQREKTFQETWAFPSELKKELKAARYYIERRLDGATFKSGREKWEARYYSMENGGLICRREAMELISKKTGKPYHVVRRA